MEIEKKELTNYNQSKSREKCFSPQTCIKPWVSN